MADLAEGHSSPAAEKFYETLCWGCGLRLLLPVHAPVFKCGWCGAITDEDTRRKHEGKSRRLGRLRDRAFVCVLLTFMVFVICGGVWAAYPVIFSINYLHGIFHSMVAAVLSLSTLCTVRLAAFKCPGKPPSITWGSYPVVGKGDLQNYTFCHYCSKPKSPRTHHCSTCQMCILDMDHHCPIIGNCVGAGNHRHFILFLLSVIVSMAYTSVMSVYTLSYIWPPVRLGLHIHTNSFSRHLLIPTLKKIVVSYLSSAALLPARGFILVYLFLAGISIGTGLTVLLWQQLGYIYGGKTYLSHLHSQDDAEGDCQNLINFFGLPYPISRLMLRFRNSWKRHKK